LNGVMLKRIDHVGILVDDIASVTAFLTSLGLPLRSASGVPVQGRRVAVFDCGNCAIEVIEDVDEKAKLANLAGHKAKIEHVAIEVDDLRSTLEALSPLGVAPNEMGIVASPERETAFTAPKALEGVVCQFVAYPRRAGS
jgi:methylmalonyl-CoA/ethylmalonyl-CoA epimerase